MLFGMAMVVNSQVGTGPFVLSQLWLVDTCYDLSQCDSDQFCVIISFCVLRYTQRH